MFQGGTFQKSNRCWEYEVINMKKKVLMRSLLGAPQGVAVSFVITIVISLIIGDGNYYPVVPELVESCGSELKAVILQTLFSFLYGAVWGGASAIWDNERWSILRQTVTHLVVCSVSSLPIAYALHWMDHSFSGVIAYFGLFFGIYLAVWLVLYFSIRKHVEQLDKKVKENNLKDNL